MCFGCNNITKRAVNNNSVRDRLPNLHYGNSGEQFVTLVGKNVTQMSNLIIVYTAITPTIVCTCIETGDCEKKAYVCIDNVTTNHNCAALWKSISAAYKFDDVMISPTWIWKMGQYLHHN